MQCSTVQCSTVQYNVGKFSTLQCNTAQCIKLQYSVQQYSPVQCSTELSITIQCSAIYNPWQTKKAKKNTNKSDCICFYVLVCAPLHVFAFVYAPNLVIALLCVLVFAPFLIFALSCGLVWLPCTYVRLSVLHSSHLCFDVRLSGSSVHMCTHM